MGSAAASALALLACGGGSDDGGGATSSTGGGEAVPEGRSPAKIVGSGGGTPPEALDPARSVTAAYTPWSYIGNLAVDIDKQTWDLKPALAESWEIPSEDSVILHVRKNVTWHNKPPTNGRQLTAEDMAYSINRHAAILDPQSPGLYPRRGNYVGLERAEVVDPLTVNLKISKPNLVLFNGMGDHRTSIMSIETQETGFDDFAKVSGTGPWMVTNVSANTTTMVPHETYWETGLPRSSGIELVRLEDAQALNASFLARQIDWIPFINRPQVDIDAVRAARPDAKLLEWEYGYWHHFRFNLQNKPFDDVRVRKALQLALNVEELGNGYYGKYWSYTGPLNTTYTKEARPASEIAELPGWNTKTKERDIEEARKLMSSAGYPDGNFEIRGVSLATGPHAASFQRAIAQWQRIWPRLRSSLDDISDSGTLFRKVANLDQWDVFAYGILPTPDAILDLISNFSTSGGRNYGKYNNPRFEDVTSRALYATDQTTRTALAREAEQILIEDMPLIWHYNANQVALIDPSWQGIEGYPGPGGYSSVDISQGTKLVYKKP